MSIIITNECVASCDLHLHGESLFCGVKSKLAASVCILSATYVNMYLLNIFSIKHSYTVFP